MQFPLIIQVKVFRNFDLIKHQPGKELSRGISGLTSTRRKRVLCNDLHFPNPLQLVNNLLSSTKKKKKAQKTIFLIT